MQGGPSGRSTALHGRGRTGQSDQRGRDRGTRVHLHPGRVRDDRSLSDVHLLLTCLQPSRPGEASVGDRREVPKSHGQGQLRHGD